jgi:hypothetical protein
MKLGKIIIRKALLAKILDTIVCKFLGFVQNIHLLSCFTPSNKPATECTMALSLKAKLKPAIVKVTIRNVPCNAPKTNSQLTITSHEHSAKCGTK